MKIIVSENKSKDYKIDVNVCNNVYCTYNLKKVKSNLKNFDIKVQSGELDKSIGIKYSKIFNNVIITCHIISEEFEICNQFLVNDKTNIYDFLMIKELEPYHEFLISAVQLSKVNTLEELNYLIDQNEMLK